MFKNPAIQKLWSELEAIALEREQPEELEDLTVPDVERHERRAGAFLKEFSGIFPKNTADEENFYDFAEFLNLLEKIHFVHFSPHKDEEVLATKA